MKVKLFLVAVCALALFNVSAAAQTNTQSQTNTSAQTSSSSTEAGKKKRPPIFRASKDQIMQAQKMMKDKNLYAGEQTGKMNDDFRAALRKYQESAQIKATGTLNKETLEKMGITLSDKQKAM